MKVTRQVRVAHAMHPAWWWGLGAGRDTPPTPPPRPCKPPVRTWHSAPSTVDLLDWNSLIDSRTKISKLLLIPNMQVGTHLCHPPSSPTRRALGVWGSNAWVCCPQPCLVACWWLWCWLASVLPEPGHAVIHRVQPPSWQGGHPVHAVLAGGGAGVGSSLGDGLPSRGYFCLPRAGLATGRQYTTSCSCFRLGSSSLCSHASPRRRICR